MAYRPSYRGTLIMGSVSNNKQICVKKHCLFKLNRIYYIKIYILIKIANGKVQLNKTIEIISFKTRFCNYKQHLKILPYKNKLSHQK